MQAGRARRGGGGAVTLSPQVRRWVGWPPSHGKCQLRHRELEGEDARREGGCAGDVLKCRRRKGEARRYWVPQWSLRLPGGVAQLYVPGRREDELGLIKLTRHTFRHSYRLFRRINRCERCKGTGWFS